MIWPKPLKNQWKNKENQWKFNVLAVPRTPPNPYESRSVWRMPELRELPSAKWTGAQMHPLLSPFPPSPRETLYYVLLSTRVRGEHRNESPRNESTQKPLRKALKSNHLEAFWCSGASGASLGCSRHPLLTGPERGTTVARSSTTWPKLSKNQSRTK